MNVRIIELPGLPEKGDLSDFVALRSDRAPEALRSEIEQLVAVTEKWEPAAESPSSIPAMTVDPISEKYGAPVSFRTSQNGNRGYAGINEAYWAGHHSASHVELFEPVEKIFYRYDPITGLYSEISPAIIKQEVSDALLQRGRKDNIEEIVRDRTDNRLTAITSQLKGIVEKRDAFRKSTNVIHLANGMLTISQGTTQLHPFAPEYFSRNKSPISFDPDAKCERFLNELILPAVHSEDVVIIQKYFGLCLLGRNIIQRFLILDGTPGGGKTQLAIVMQQIIGLLNCTQLRTEHLNNRFEVFRYRSKTLLVGVDVPADFLSTKGATVIKALVGGDYLDAEQKGGTGNFQMEGVFCCVLTSNSRLRVRLEGDVDAWRRRMIIVRYEAPPPKKKIPEFAKRLVEAEGPGMLNWAIAGLAALMHDVETSGNIHLTERQIRLVDSLLSESDSLRVFLRDRVVKDTGSDLTNNEIISSYAEYCPTKGWNPLPVTNIQHQIESLMLELFQTARSNSIDRGGKSHRGFRNVRIIDLGTPGTGISNSRAYGRETTEVEYQDNAQKLIESETSVPSVPSTDLLQPQRLLPNQLLTPAEIYLDQDYVFQERAAIREYDARMTRSEAERLADDSILVGKEAP